MIPKKIKKLLENSGVIACLTSTEKKQLTDKGYTVQEIETPCVASGNQSIERC